MKKNKIKLDVFLKKMQKDKKIKITKNGKSKQ